MRAKNPFNICVCYLFWVLLHVSNIFVGFEDDKSDDGLKSKETAYWKIKSAINLLAAGIYVPLISTGVLEQNRSYQVAVLGILILVFAYSIHRSIENNFNELKDYFSSYSSAQRTLRNVFVCAFIIADIAFFAMSVPSSQNQNLSDSGIQIQGQ